MLVYIFCSMPLKDGLALSDIGYASLRTLLARSACDPSTLPFPGAMPLIQTIPSRAHAQSWLQSI